MRGSLRRRDRRKTVASGPERWELRVYLGRDERGKEQQATRAFSGTKREAQSALAAFVAETERRRRTRTSRMPFGDYALQWLEQHRSARDLGIKTFERYDGIIQHHLVPVLGHLPLRTVGASHVRAAIAAWRNGERRDRKHGPLSPKTVHHHFALLRQLLDDAVRERLIVDNPTFQVRAPAIGTSHRRTYTIEQIAELLRYLESTPLAVPVMMKSLTGLRRGEILALRWRNVDLEKGVAQIVEALVRDKEGNIFFKAPKTELSRRPVLLPQALIEALRAYRHLQEQRHSTLGLPTPDLVFGDVEGKPWDPDAFSSAFAYQIRRSGLPRISLQELRHSYASIAQRLGTSLTTTSRSLGHSTITITGDIYSHILIDDLRKAAVRIDDAFSLAIQEREQP